MFILIKVSVSSDALAGRVGMSEQSIRPVERIIVSVLYRRKNRLFLNMWSRMYTFIVSILLEYVISRYSVENVLIYHVLLCYLLIQN